MARRAAPRQTTGKQVDDYRHDDAQRLNNPEAGLARYETQAPPRKRYDYDPHLDPQLVWAGKAEHTSFDVDAVSVHVHERLSSEAIVRTLRKEPPQLALFGDPQLERDREVEFYQHEVDWTNRLILGDSLVVMTSLLERERMGGQVQCIYLDPPYGINYNSNFQARISDRSPTETKDDAVTREPEQIQAYRDTWTLGVHSYLSYLRDRLLVARELLADEGSIFVQIGADRMHLVRVLLDEIFGAVNACPLITVRKTAGHASRLVPETSDFLLWYAKDKAIAKYHQLFDPRSGRTVDDGTYKYVLLTDGSSRSITNEERANTSLLPVGAHIYKLDNITSEGFSAHKSVDFEFDGLPLGPGKNKHWKLRLDGMAGLAAAGRLEVSGKRLWYRRFWDDFGATELSNIWMDTSSSFARRSFVVQTVPKIVSRCILMTSDPGDLILDPTCGSGTTAYVAERFGRRWITMDTSRVALAIARERVLTATYPYYRLIDETRGVDQGLRYRAIERITASSIGYGSDSDAEVLYDQPEVDNSKVRVSGPFTVEALSRYAVNPMQDDVPPDPGELNVTADHVEQFIDALRARGVPVKGGRPVRITALARIASTSPLHGEGETEDGQSLVVSVGPRYGPITVQQMDEALGDAAGYDLVVFCGYTATAEAQQWAAKGRIGKYQVVLLEANADLLVGDLLKNTPASQTFRLFAAPDVAFHRADEDGEVYVELRGIDVYDPVAGEATSRTRGDVAAWFLDHDYDGEVFHVCQAFFPKSNAWDALARALKGTLDEEALARLAEFQSNPFTPGEHKKAAVRVIDDSGQTSEAVLDLA